MLDLLVLTVPGCPNAPLIESRLSEAMSGRFDVRVIRRIVEDQDQAERLGMRGSPTLLVDGIDPFAEPGTPFSVSCRMYRVEGGRLEGSPSVDALRQAIRPRP
jgi:hypothetical protein